MNSVPEHIQKAPYFTSDQINSNLSEVRQMLMHGERVSNFIANLFETERDGAIEWYEFLDFLLVLKDMKRPLDRKCVQEAMKVAGKTGIDRPWTFDENGICSMPGSLDAAKAAFARMDSNHDGVLDNKELYGL
jgi:hypothetical protein